MNRGLYIVSLISFYAYGTLTDVPASVLFAWEDRVVKNEKGQEFRWTKEAARDYWDRISAAGELRFAHMRDMVLADCTQPTARYHKVAMRQFTSSVTGLGWSKSGTLAVHTADDRPNAGQITLYNERLETLGASTNTLEVGSLTNPPQIALNLDEDKLAILHYSNASGKNVRTLSIFSFPFMIKDQLEERLSEPLKQLEPLGFLHETKALAWVTDDSIAVGRVTDNSIGILDIATNVIAATLRVPRTRVCARFLSKVNGKGHLASMTFSTWGISPRIHLFDVVRNEFIKELRVEYSDYQYIEWGADGNSLELGTEYGTLVSVDVLTGKLTGKGKLPFCPHPWAMAPGPYAKTAVGYGHPDGGIDIWQDANHTLKQYFERDAMGYIRGKKLSFNQVYAQMVMTKLFFDLKQKGKALKIPEVVAEINRRAGQDVTSAQELAEIRDTFPHPEQRALQKVFNISKIGKS